MAYIYKITNTKNGKVYIGSTKYIQARKKCYEQLRCRQQVRLYNSINKYGWSLHLFEILEECTTEDQFFRERYWQEFYDVTGVNGLNCLLVRTDVKPCIMSEETRRKMSLSRKGLKKSKEWQDKINFAKKGSTLSEDHKLKISMTKLGTKESEETREKKRLMRLGKKHSSETKEKIRKGQQNKKVFSKRVVQYDPVQHNVIKVWENCKQVSTELNISLAYLRDAARGKYNNKAHGFVWKYEEK